jgi:hypothetical protein
MKVTLDFDCTADEARAFLGLPDVKPMQAAVMATLEKQAVQAAEQFAPDSMLKLWFTTLPQMSSQMQDMFARMVAGGTTRS